MYIVIDKYTTIVWYNQYFVYLCPMEMDLSKYSIDELVELRNTINGVISDYRDGYFYICNVRSYGRNWVDKWIHNTHTLQELCYQYDGEDGIVDVFSNNPDLSKIDNYGNVMYVPTIEDYEKSKKYDFLVRIIPEAEETLAEWGNRDNIPFQYRPRFEPFYTREVIDRFKSELENFDMSFVAPVPVKRIYDDEEE